MSRHGKTLKRLARHEQKGSTRCCLCCFFFLPSTVTQTLAALLLLLRPLKREILAAGKKRLPLLFKLPSRVCPQSGVSPSRV